MKEKFLIIPNNKKMIKTLNKQGFNSFILPLKNFSVGFDQTYDLEEINALAKKYKISIILNKFLHKNELSEVKKIIKQFKNINKFLIEDLAYTKLIEKEKIVIFQNHLITNYKSINLYNTLGYKNIVISNELKIDEIKEIIKNTKSNLYMFVINKNMILYSKRKLITNYSLFFKKHLKNKSYLIKESVSKKELIIKEEENSTFIFDSKVFCAYKYLEELKDQNLIVNLNNMNKKELKIIIKNIENKDLYKLINSDYFFLENSCPYKVKGGNSNGNFSA